MSDDPRMIESEDAIAAVQRHVDDERDAQGGDWPNTPSAATYVRHAESLGFKAQEVCGHLGSTGCYYAVHALYDTDDIFGTEPVALVFEDFSTSVQIAWLMRRA